MKSLIIDTSHNISFLILTDNKKIVFFKKIETPSLSKNLFSALDSALKESNIKISELNYIAASLGPGSFTGLRVGASICKTFNFTNNIPLIGYISLMAYTPKKDCSFIAAFDAKTDGFFAIEGTMLNKKISYSSDPKLISSDEFEKLCLKADIIISPDIEAIKSKITINKNKFEEAFFDPTSLIELTDNLYNEKKFYTYLSFDLLYMRGPNHIE
ncbi:MAG: tRNA (adenosine(37)-N6)-threonylcarbamoyltransferase complex dimerization subunit type 1 TsaB [Parachlamydiales bacterium]|jgi:tRNA threonylcarbamoyladenosine biosynthesis protein TsaB